jgi:hypothetical protein
MVIAASLHVDAAPFAVAEIDGAGVFIAAAFRRMQAVPAAIA